MTDAELERLLARCPVLYHMAAGGSWPSIRAIGLLSTTALLDRYGIIGAEREALESVRRPRSVVLRREGLAPAEIRDQIPMDDAGLLRCLRDGLTPRDWYRSLNRKVFFWLTRDRLRRLQTAKTYRDRTHDVLVVDSRALVAAYRPRIWLCSINSGYTRRGAQPRGISTFQRIVDYDYAARRGVAEKVVELAVDYAIPDIKRFVLRVEPMEACQTIVANMR